MSLVSMLKKRNISVRSDAAKEFLAEIEEHYKKVDKAYESAVYEFAREVVYKTPYGLPDTWAAYWRSVRGVEEGRYKPGHLRANWQMGTFPPTSEVTGEDMSGVKSLSNIAQNLDGVQPVYHFANTAPYASQIEFGYSQQAPNGMLRKTLAEWPTIKKKYGITF